MSSKIRWVFGAPGVLARISIMEPGNCAFVTVGIFVGDIKEVIESNTRIIFEGVTPGVESLKIGE